MDGRRQAARTDETTLSEGLARNLALERIVNFAHSTGISIDKIVVDAQSQDVAKAEDQALVKAGLEDAKSPRDILKKTLSVRSVLSTSSSFAERMEALRNANLKTLKLGQIGRGSFGTVFEIPGTEWCLKKTLTAPKKLWDEFNNGLVMRKEVNGMASDAIFRSEEFPTALMPRVPRYLWSHGMSDAESATRWFKENGHRFPVENGGQKPGPIICLERIMPLPKVIRENLIRLYFEPGNQEAALADKANKSCLCRPYLGCRSSEIAPDKREKELQTLQNFPLYLNQLEDLGVEPLTIAQDMALGLAAGHWAAYANMLDVEYVIGSRPSTSPETLLALDADEQALRSRSSHRRVRDMRPREIRTSFRNRALQLWMIDFNKVTLLEPSLGHSYHAEIRQLVSDTRATDGPYYPRALPKTEADWKLWIAFAQTYISASKIILNYDLSRGRRSGSSQPEKDIKLILKRPSNVIHEWMRAESIEYKIDLDQYISQAKKNGWPMP
ncbi:unnamed protein product [Clonostachys rosea]|uniref:DUF3669 domain-containing protein n=1 Tax=Bionectria ochroleuca TaxID=29856 RepID=A0ABY6TS78_BIOOC|nr:unnamed protein product [Clonostachys rosea]